MKHIKHIYFLLGSTEVISHYRKGISSPLLKSPFDFVVLKYTIYEPSLKVIRECILYESYQEITEEEYHKFYKYLNGALDLIFTQRLLEVSRQGMDTNKSK